MASTRATWGVLSLRFQKHLRHTSLHNISYALGPAATKHFEAREIALARLENTQSALLEEMEQARIRREQAFEAKEQALEDKFAEKQHALEAEIKARKEQQDSRETELQKQRTELDDRAAKHARRQHYKDIKIKFSAWSKEFAVTPGTSRMRLSVWVAAGVLLLASGGIEALLIWKSQSLPNGDTSQFVANIVRQVIVAGVFISTAVFLIRFNNQWFQRHADEEFRLKRMELDIDRASWFVEMAFEWQDEKGATIPTELVDRLTQGLFTYDRSENLVEPADSALHALLGASNLKFKLPGGTEAEYGRGEIKKSLRPKD